MGMTLYKLSIVGSIGERVIMQQICCDTFQLRHRLTLPD